MKKKLGLLLLIVACGGKLQPDEVHFAPESRSAGYGLIGGMHVTLVDPSSDHIKRTLKIDASNLGGSFEVASGARVTLVEDRGPAGTATFTGVSGTVTIEAIAGGGAFGSEHVHVDVTLTDGERDVHIVGDYDAVLAYIG